MRLNYSLKDMAAQYLMMLDKASTQRQYIVPSASTPTTSLLPLHKWCWHNHTACTVCVSSSARVLLGRLPPAASEQVDWDQGKHQSCLGVLHGVSNKGEERLVLLVGIAPRAVGNEDLITFRFAFGLKPKAKRAKPFGLNIQPLNYF